MRCGYRGGLGPRTLDIGFGGCLLDAIAPEVLGGVQSAVGGFGDFVRIVGVGLGGRHTDADRHAGLDGLFTAPRDLAGYAPFRTLAGTSGGPTGDKEVVLDGPP